MEKLFRCNKSDKCKMPCNKREAKESNLINIKENWCGFLGGMVKQEQISDLEQWVYEKAVSGEIIDILKEIKMNKAEANDLPDEFIIIVQDPKNGNQTSIEFDVNGSWILPLRESCGAEVLACARHLKRRSQQGQ